MLDGQETVEIVCRELGGSETACWTEKNCANSLRGASLGGSETAC